MLFISWIFVLASHSTNIFLLFIRHRTNWPIFAFPFFHFLGGGKAPSPSTMDKRLSAHPIPFCMYSVSISPLISLVKHRSKRLNFHLTAFFFSFSRGGGQGPLAATPSHHGLAPVRPPPSILHVCSVCRSPLISLVKHR